MAKSLQKLLQETIVPPGLTLDDEKAPRVEFLLTQLVTKMRQEQRFHIAVAMNTADGDEYIFELRQNTTGYQIQGGPAGTEFELSLPGFNEWYFFDQSGRRIYEVF